MKIRTVLFILGLTGIVVSCIPSLYPLYREKDLLIDNRLEGLLILPDGWTKYNSGLTYKLTVREQDKIEDFSMHLLKLGDDLYLDFFPADYQIRHDFLDMHLVPTHIFAKVELTDQYLILHFFDIEWLEKLIETNRIKISYVELEDRYLLTAKTEELQKFITKFANDSTTFIEPDTLIRQEMSAGSAGLYDLLNNL
jgi:hypothetical protein